MKRASVLYIVHMVNSQAVLMLYCKTVLSGGRDQEGKIGIMSATNVAYKKRSMALAVCYLTINVLNVYLLAYQQMLYVQLSLMASQLDALVAMSMIVKILFLRSVHVSVRFIKTSIKYVWLWTAMRMPLLENKHALSPLIVLSKTLMAALRCSYCSDA